MAQAIDFTAVKNTVHLIKETYGTAVIKNDNQLIAHFADLAPQAKHEMVLLRAMVSCNGVQRLLDAVNLSPKEQQICLKKVTTEICENTLITEDNTILFCNAFFLGIGGEQQIKHPPQKEKSYWFLNYIKKHIPAVITLSSVFLLVIVLLVVILFRDTSISEVLEAIDQGNYKEAVEIYNDRISGHKSKEAEVRSLFSDTLQTLRQRYLARESTYEETCEILQALSQIRSAELSKASKDALLDIQLQESSLALYTKGIDLLDNHDYYGAIETFLSIDESSTFYGDAKEKVFAICGTRQDAFDYLYKASGISNIAMIWNIMDAGTHKDMMEIIGGRKA